MVVEDAHSSPTDPHGVPITISTVSPPFIVPVPMTTADGTGWIQNVHVYPKNETMSITKTADVTDAGTAVKVGDIVNYTITSTIPNEIAGAQEYSITDTLDDALDYQVGSVNVTADGVDLTLDQDYTVSYDDSTRILTVSFTNGNPVVADNGIAKLDGHKEVTITFAAQVNAGILGKADLSVPNEATLSFVNATGDPVITANTNDLGPVIHTAAIKLTKVDEDGTTPLPGAEFQIATSYENATHGIFLKKDPTTQAFVDSSPNATDTSAYDAADDYVLALTDDSATGQFVGLADTIDLATNTSDGTPENAYQKYWIVETQAPATYNLLTDPIEVDMYSLVGTLTTTDPYVYVLGDVVNHSGFTLPFAGGVGTVAFTVVGIVLIGTAIIVVSTKRRRKSTLD
ncbi:MAG: SpaH/EbpB family LPXTG-anchored major pilin [Coriobacteriia bacterium]|nr:SpaH/EbpB family LPXTG-anchored major pilin [Coriobacteriia bacterium]